MRTHLSPFQKLGFDPNCQEKSNVAWEKRQGFGTKGATYPVQLPSDKRGKPVVWPLQRAEEVLKSASY